MRNFKLLSGSIILLLLISLSCKTAVKEVAKPNFLFIITDDQSFQAIHAMGNEMINTPNMDKLCEEGVVFTHCFNQGSWSGAVCVASRTMLNTGRTLYNAPKNRDYLPWSNGIKDGEKEEVKTWGQSFKEAGYETFLTGKWHNSSLAALRSFDQAKAIGKGMYETYDKNHSTKDAYSRPSNGKWTPWDKAYTGHWTPSVSDFVYDENGKASVGKAYKENKHTSELFADHAIEFLETTAKEGAKPFFMYVSFNAPHDPRQSPKEYIEMYDKEKIPIPKNFLPEHLFDQGDHKIRDEKLAPFPRTKEAVQLHLQEYYAITSHVDHEVGRIMDALKKSGKADNTYVIFTSDHGLAVGQHGLMGKQNQYDHSIRMPFIMVGAGLEKGKKLDDMIYMQSVFATTCELAGISTPETVQFKSILELAKGNSEEKGEELIYGGYKNMQRMIRTKTHKLILYPQVKEAQLFDLVNDPDEIVNLIANKNQKEIREDMFNKLVYKQKELNDKLVLVKSDYF